VRNLQQPPSPYLSRLKLCLSHSQRLLGVAAVEEEINVVRCIPSLHNEHVVRSHHEEHLELIIV